MYKDVRVLLHVEQQEGERITYPSDSFPARTLGLADLAASAYPTDPALACSCNAS